MWGKMSEVVMVCVNIGTKFTNVGNVLRKQTRNNERCVKYQEKR
jgi:hypothetical protein